MNEKAILLPLFVQVAVTGFVWVWMYVTRVKEILVCNIEIQDLADSAKSQSLLRRVAAPSDNLINLFEIPVLFYLAIILVFVSHTSDAFYLGASWCFVALRFLHSLVHITYNSVIHRFSLYFISTIILWIIWIRLFFQWIATG